MTTQLTSLELAQVEAPVSMNKVLTLLLLLFLSGCMSFAITGQVADAGTTYYGMEEGLEEGNPLYSDIESVIIGKAIVLTLGILLAENSPPEAQKKIYGYLGCFGWGAALWNGYVIQHTGDL